MHSDPAHLVRTFLTVLLTVTLNGSLAVQAVLAAVRPTVAIVKSSSLGPFQQATDRIVQTLERSSIEPELLIFDLEGSADNAAIVLGKVRDAQPTLVIPIGTLATGEVLRCGWSIPIVFSMVLYPTASGFVSGNGQVVTGASLDLPFDVVFRTLRRLFPAARRLGVLYHPAETGNVVEESRLAAQAHAFTVESKVIEGPHQVLSALDSLMEQVDIVWGIPDSRVFTPQTTSALILATLRRGIPLVGLSAGHVRNGALAAFTSDYDDVGLQTAEIALRILRGESAETIPISVPRKITLALNLRTAARLGVTVSPDLIREAGEVIR